MPNPKKRVLIVGGGIAGVTLFRVLANDARFDVTLVERGNTWRTIGYAVGIWKIGVDVLLKLPLGEEFWNNTYPVSQGVFFNANGKVLEQIDYTKLFAGEHGAVTVERDVLHRALTEGLPAQHVRFSTTITGIVPKKDGVTVTLNDGTTDTYDLLVGADGIRSDVRKKVFGERLRRSGWVAWCSWSPQSLAKLDGYYSMSAPGEFLLSIPHHGRCAVGLIRANVPKHVSFTLPKSREQIGESFSALARALPDVVRAIGEPKDMFVDELCFVNMKKWYDGRVVLVGDAAHGLSPVSGWGTSLALEDGYALAEALKTHEQIDTALAVFVKERNRVLKRVRRFSSLLDRLILVKTRKGVLIRNFFMRLMPHRLALRLLADSLKR